MKNIWIINHYAKLDSGRHFKFAENLVKRGYKVRIINASTSVDDISKSYKIRLDTQNKGVNYSIIKAREYYGNGKERMKNMLEFSYRAYKSLSKEKENYPDVIYASSVHPLNWVVGYYLSKKYKSKLVIETRDLWPETLIRMGRITSKSIPARLLYKLERFIYKKADHLIFTMPGGEKYLNERKINFKKISYINNGVDVEEFENNIIENPYVLKKEGNSFNVVYAGSMGIANSLKPILDAAKYLQDNNYKNIYFHFFGDGYLEEELKGFAEEQNLKNVKFYGRVLKQEIPSILRQADLNIATSQNISIYNYGVSLNKYFDYFASGKPTLSNIPSPYNKVEKYKCGITVSPEDSEAIANGIIKISELDEVVYNEICLNAFSTAKIFDFKNLTTELEKTFE